MAEKRMFTKTVIDSDAFLDMPTSSQALYFHLAMRADDDGFINNAKKIQKIVGAADDDLKILLAKRFLIPFEGGIVVIKHWRMHNYIAKDRYHATHYQKELKSLTIKKNGAYTECIRNDDEMLTEIRLDKIRLDKDREEKSETRPFLEEPEEQEKEQPESLETFCKTISEAWKTAGIKPAFRFMTSANLSTKEREAFGIASQKYTLPEILEAVRNYGKIRSSPNHEAFPKDYGLPGFLTSGIDQYLSDADPFTRCAKEKPQEADRSKIINGMNAEGRTCPVPGCGNFLPGTLTTCSRCGWSLGDDIEENLDWYEANLKRKNKVEEMVF